MNNLYKIPEERKQFKNIKNWWKSKPNTPNFQNQLCQKLHLPGQYKISKFKSLKKKSKKDLFILVAPSFTSLFKY